MVLAARFTTRLSLAIGLLLAGAIALPAQNSAVLPLLTVEDKNGNVVGPVVGFLTAEAGFYKDALPLLKLSGLEGKPYFLYLSDGLVGLDLYLATTSDSEVLSVYFPLADCNDSQGAYLVPGGPRIARSNSQIYGLAVTLDGSRKVYGASLEAVAQTVQLESRYNQNTRECENISTNILPVYVASEVLDITSEHPPPYTLR
jgi:hypothetical protein